MHVLDKYHSKMEYAYDDGHIRTDHQTAHQRVGDTGYSLWLPDTCKKCFDQEQEASELGWIPTAPDQAIPHEVIDGLS